MKRSVSIIVLLFLCGSGFYFLPGCNQYKRNKAHPEISVSDIEKGDALAHRYCQSCHAFPDPALLDAEHWEKGALPNMGPHLGIFEYNMQRYPSHRYDPNLHAGYYPSKPLLTMSEWGAILAYYVTTSPDSLPAQQRSSVIRNDLQLFDIQSPQPGYHAPATCFIKVDTFTLGRHSLLVADAIKRKIFRFNTDLLMVDSISTKGPVVDIDLGETGMTACNIGILNPNNGKFGAGQRISLNGEGRMVADSLPLFDSLQRPVQLIPADINHDGRMDYVVCEFGYFTGALSWMENTKGNSYIRHVIRAVPGAIKAYVQDYNHDGLPDLWVLFAQADEGIFLFTNKGNGVFSSEKVLQFPPIYGSSYFELADFNKDGFPDILYTCGDNADYSIVLKPYHGVYIFLNDGKNHFKQKYFFPLNGCYKAMARDFDGDGDLDIAAISFFADYVRQPDEGFVYLENKGDFNFLPHSSSFTRAGRWLTMDAGDFDGDGKPDILLGNFSIAPGFIKAAVDWKTGPPFLLLKNTGRGMGSGNQDKH